MTDANAGSTRTGDNAHLKSLATILRAVAAKVGVLGIGYCLKQMDEHISEYLILHPSDDLIHRLKIRIALVRRLVSECSECRLREHVIQSVTHLDLGNSFMKALRRFLGTATPFSSWFSGDVVDGKKLLSALETILPGVRPDYGAARFVRDLFTALQEGFERIWFEEAATEFGPDIERIIVALEDADANALAVAADDVELRLAHEVMDHVFSIRDS